MTTIEKVNLLPNLLKQNKITEKKAIDFLCTELIKNSAQFLNRIADEDFLSELILEVLSTKKNLFEIYNDETTSFFEFFKSFLFYKTLTIKKRFAKKRCNKTKLFLELEIFKNEIDKYDEYCLKNSTFTPYQIQENEKAPYTRAKNFTNFEKKEFDLKNHVKNLTTKEKTTLLCSIKYLYYLDFENLQAIAKLCKIPEKVLFEIKEKFSETFANKSKKIDILREQRNKAYFLKRKYSFELENMSLNDYEFSSKEKLVQLQTNFWKNKITQLKSKRNIIVPSNKVIANTVGLNERTVSFYLNKAKDFDIAE